MSACRRLKQHPIKIKSIKSTSVSLLAIFYKIKMGQTHWSKRADSIDAPAPRRADRDETLKVQDA